MTNAERQKEVSGVRFQVFPLRLPGFGGQAAVPLAAKVAS